MPKVASVYPDDDNKLVITVGKENQVKKGDKYLVYELGDHVYDPDTKADLGQLEIIKGIGKVIHVQDKMSVIESIKVKKANEKRIVYSKPPYSGIFTGLISHFATEEVIKEGEDEILPFDAPKVGDLAKYIP